jgi:hypothetical protein
MFEMTFLDNGTRFGTTFFIGDAGQAAAGVPGDYNNGIVGAADYVPWRRRTASVATRSSIGVKPCRLFRISARADYASGSFWFDCIDKLGGSRPILDSEPRCGSHHESTRVV